MSERSGAPCELFDQNDTIHYIGYMNTKTVTGFISSLSLEESPAGLSVYEKALWFAGKGEWEKAHERFRQQRTRLRAARERPPH